MPDAVPDISDVDRAVLVQFAVRRLAQIERERAALTTLLDLYHGDIPEGQGSRPADVPHAAPQTSPARPRSPALPVGTSKPGGPTETVLAIVNASLDGISPTDMIDRAVGRINTHAKNKRHMLASLALDLANKGRMRKDAETGWYYPAHALNGNGPQSAVVSDNGRVPELALDR